MKKLSGNSKLDLKKNKVAKSKKNTVSKKPLNKILNTINLNREIIEASPIGTLIYQALSGTCVFANAAVAQMSGGSIEQLCKQNFRKIKSWQKSGMYDAAEKAIKSSKTQIIECDSVSTFKKHFRVKVVLKSFLQNGEKFLLAQIIDISDRKNHELNLGSQMNKYRMLMKTSQDAIHIVDKKGNLIEWNDAFLKHLGYTITEAAKLNIADWDLKWNRKDLEKIIKSTDEKGVAFDTLHKCKNGELKDTAIRVHRIYFNSKELYYASARDITERKINEQKLKESEERYHNLVSNLHVGVLVQGPKAEMLLCNQRALDLLGLTENQLLGKTSFDKSWNVIHEDGSDFPGAKHPVPVCIATRKSVRNVVMGVYRPKTKDRVWLLVNADPLLNKDGTVKEVICIFKDFTDIKNVQFSLEESEEKYRMIVETSNDGIVMLDENSNIIFSNKQISKLTGYTPSELIGKPIFKFINGKNFERGKEETQRRKKGISNQYEINITKKDGTELCVLISASPRIIDKKIAGSLLMLLDISEKKKTEADLKLKEESISKSSSGMGMTDLSGNIIYVNETVGKMWGYENKDELIGKKLTDVFYGDLVFKTLQNLKTRGFDQGEDIAIKKDGTLFDVEFSANIINGDDGKPKCMFGSFIDITEKKKFQRALQVSESLYRELTYHSPSGIVLLDSNNNYKFFSKTCERLTGFKSEEMIGLNPVQHTHPEDLPDLQKKLFEMLQNPGFVFTTQYRFAKKDGTWLWIESTFSNLLHVPGVEAISININDINEWKLAQNKLEKNELLFRSLIENSTDMIALIDKNSNVKYLSPSVQKQMCWNIKDSIGKRTIDFIHPDDLQTQAETVQKSLSNPETPLTHHIRFKTANDTYMWVESVFTNHLKVEGINAFVINFRDITERKEAEVKLKKEHLNLLKLSDYIQKQEANIRSVFDNSFTGFALMDTHFEVKLFNQVMQDFIQKEFGEKIENRKNILNFINGYVNGRLKEELPKILTGNIFKIESNFTGVSGKPHWYHIRLFPSYDGKKNIVGIVLAVSDINEKKQAELEMRTNDELLKTIVENTQNLVTLTAENDTMVFISKQCKDVIGFDGTKYIGKKMPLRIYADDIKACFEKWQNLKSKGENILHHEYRLVNDDGSLRWISHSAKSVVVDGKVKYIQSSIRNITERKNNEELLKENEYLLKTSQQVSHIGSYVLDMKTKKWKATKNLTEIFGISYKDEYTTKDWNKIIHPDFVELTTEYFTDDFNKLNPLFNKEYKIINQQTGSECWVSDIGEIILENGTSKMYGTMQDITERKKNEELIKESEYLLKTSQEISKIGSYILDIQKQLWQGSETLHKLFGMTASHDHSVKGWLSIVHPEHRKMMSDYFSNEVIANKKRFDKEYKVQNIEDGKTYWVHGIGELSLGKNGKPIKMIGTIQNITERKTAEELIALKTNELERFNNTMIGRELKMIELKKEINALLTQQGLAKKYKILS